MTKISFGDTVKVRDTRITEAKGLNGLTGSVYGETTPSSSGVNVIGFPEDDFALNVYFKDRNEDFWFAPDLLDFLSHGEDLTMTLDGIDTVWVRDREGNWTESKKN